MKYAPHIPAIVLSCDRYHGLAHHMVRAYEDVWPSHPFEFLVPYQESLPDFQGLKDKVTFVESPGDIRGTVLALLEPFDDAHWIYWCVDDKYPVQIDQAICNRIANWVRGLNDSPVDGVLFCRCRKLLDQENLRPGTRLEPPGLPAFVERKNYYQFWIPQFMRVRVLRELFAGFPCEPFVAKEMDTFTGQEPGMDVKPFRDGQRMLVSERNFARFGESTVAGKLTRNCFESMARYAIPVPPRFEVVPVEWLIGEMGDDQQSRDGPKDDATRPDRLPVVFVVGMHRSGTSALARVLNLAGLAMSDKVLAPNQDNPRGYWEPVDVVALNSQLLQRFDRHWADPKPLGKDLWGRIEASDVASAAAILQSHGTDDQGQAQPLVIKDPRLCRLAPVWTEAAKRAGRKPLCLLACRHPENVYRSLHARERIPREHALDLWLAYMLEAELGTRGQPRMVVQYDALLADWRAVLGSIHQETGLLSDRGIAEGAARIDAFLDSGQRHHGASGQDGTVGPSVLEQLVDACYRAFVDGELDESRFDDLRRRWQEDWRRRSPRRGGSDLAKSLPAWHAEQAAGASASGDHAAALEALQRAIALAPDIARFHFLAGKALVELSRPEEAVERYAKAVELDPSVARFHKPLLQLLRQQKRYREAADVARALVELEPSAAHSRELGLCLAALGDFGGAVDAEGQALALGAGNAPTQLVQAMQSGVAPPAVCDRLGNLYAEHGRWPKATTAYSCALERRQALFGFRANGVTTGHPPPAKAELCALLARLGVRYRSETLLRLFERQAPTDLELRDTWWPFGSAFPYRPRVELSSLPSDIGRKRPRLSVMIPVYNVADAQWLKACLASVLAQDKGPEWAEIVVVDDASDTDRAREIVDDYRGRVRYERNRETLGLVGNHNHCIEVARGEFVHLLHQDDTVEPGFYDAVLEPMVADERLVAAFTHNRFIDAAGNSMGASDPPRPQQGVLVDWHIRLSLEIRIQFPCIVVRRSTYAAVGGFYPGRRFSFDWDLWNRVAASGPVWYDRRPLASYRVHPDSATYRFRQKERVIDAMQTVANMVQLAPVEARAAVAEMGMYKFFHRYWSLITAAELGADGEGRLELAHFFLEGWTTPEEQRQLLQLLDVS